MLFQCTHDNCGMHVHSVVGKIHAFPLGQGHSESYQSRMILVLQSIALRALKSPIRLIKAHLVPCKFACMGLTTG